MLSLIPPTAPVGNSESGARLAVEHSGKRRLRLAKQPQALPIPRIPQSRYRAFSDSFTKLAVQLCVAIPNHLT